MTDPVHILPLWNQNLIAALTICSVLTQVRHPMENFNYAVASFRKGVLQVQEPALLGSPLKRIPH